MIKAMEVLLCAWGREAVNPAVEVSIPSPLGRMDDEGGAVRAPGSRCLSTVECWVAMSRAAQAVDKALHDLALDAPAGLGVVGRTMVQLAHVRYCQERPVPVAQQAHRLGVSVRTYRTRVDALHVELARVLPGVAVALRKAEQQLPATVARVERGRQAVKASRAEQRELDRRVAQWLFKDAS
ncbi:hypothetical protein [Pseudomonas sp. Ga0074129]|uniref:hypothetical protein n=1 Tax=Pseudomonas sp. Ga0074129 TaxID=1752219 RepID=UPI000AF1EA21|nr:hypothetical protein [Pseudomonas sp. Ga0074129]